MRQEQLGRNAQHWQKGNKASVRYVIENDFHILSYLLTHQFFSFTSLSLLVCHGITRGARTKAMQASSVHSHEGSRTALSLLVLPTVSPPGEQGRARHTRPSQLHCLRHVPRAASASLAPELPGTCGASPTSTHHHLKPQHWKSQVRFLSGLEALCHLNIRTIKRAKPRHKGYLFEWRVLKWYYQELHVMWNWFSSCPGFLREGQCINLRASVSTR